VLKCPSEDFLIPLNQLDSMEPILIRGGALGQASVGFRQLRTYER